MLFHQFAFEVLAEAGRDGFQPCLMDTGAPVPTPNWERRMTIEAVSWMCQSLITCRHLVIVTLAVHVMDVGAAASTRILFPFHIYSLPKHVRVWNMGLHVSVC